MLGVDDRDFWCRQWAGVDWEVYIFPHVPRTHRHKPQRQDNQGMGILLLQAVDDLDSRQWAGGDWEVFI